MENFTIFTFIGDIGGSEMVLIMFAILLLFGAKRIPELARSLGRGIREFKDATREIRNDLEKPLKDENQDNR
ncbi:preprotein translocase subunit TatA [Pontibacter sp. HJ8]